MTGLPLLKTNCAYDEPSYEMASSRKVRSWGRLSCSTYRVSSAHRHRDANTARAKYGPLGASRTPCRARQTRQPPWRRLCTKGVETETAAFTAAYAFAIS